MRGVCSQLFTPQAKGALNDRLTSVQDTLVVTNRHIDAMCFCAIDETGKKKHMMQTNSNTHANEPW